MTIAAPRIGTIIFAALAVATPALAAFPDVSASHPNYNAIMWASQKTTPAPTPNPVYLIQGYGDGTFRPNNTISRAEFVKIAIDANTLNIGGYAGISLRKLFSDVVAGDWYATHLVSAVEKGLIHGYPDGTFRPANRINFVEAAKIIANADAGDALTPSGKNWYDVYVNYLAERNAIPETIEYIDSFVTRGEMVEMMYRLNAGVTNKQSNTYEKLSGGGEADVEYVLRYNNETKTGLLIEEEYDGAILKRDKRTGRETIVISSIKDALPELQETWNLTLRVFAKPEGSSVIIFKSALMETDNASGTLYRFDVSAQTFTKMRLNDVYDGGFYNGLVLSPDRRHIAWAGGASDADEGIGFVQTLFVGSLLEDSHQDVLHLSGRETLNGGGYALSSNYDITWSGNSTIRYAVYDQTKKDAGASPTETLIGYRSVTIQ